MKHVSLLGLVLLTLSGCYSTGFDPNYAGPPPRPPELDKYYDKGSSYQSFTEESLGKNSDYELKRILLQSEAGEIKIDYYHRPEKSKELILVFPLLGGGNIISEYFADYFTRRGFESAIIHRVNDFKKPENFDRLEEILRDGVVRDRISLDFFEDHYGKSNFGTFGISRGAINVAISAGADERFKCNVIAMGGSDLPSLFRDSSQSRLRKYVRAVTEARDITTDQFYELLNQRIKTDPKYLSRYMDAKNTLMFVSLLDHSVPYKYGMKLKHEIGNPTTYYLLADHYTSILYTEFVQLVPPGVGPGIFPLDFIEGTSLNFYKHSFKRGRQDFRAQFMNVLQIPGNIIAKIINELF